MLLLGKCDHKTTYPYVMCQLITIVAYEVTLVIQAATVFAAVVSSIAKDVIVLTKPFGKISRIFHRTISRLCSTQLDKLQCQNIRL
ncbi:uncharacterized protein PHALS_15243 [Plasmopara halstedii]|uniref:Uncharacterized protein n=1 Tax=Plasmopara halstedii TaxID=4781 RepID=A0A0P1B6K4_PLAHL|nr:uncharacterized protein PHALS_15243 [Plasmopara halstedii]CEG49872.1 hypothetical protein PHALS_15243 [Plasmopara halstedii]|eukprot:XP_024586241.1 hypothetical protein PHALS_15243 [Plasmopara halstedii]